MIDFKKGKIARLDNEYHKKKRADFKEEEKNLIFRQRRLIAIFSLAIVVMLSIGFQVIKDGRRLLHVRQQETKLETKETKLAEEKEELKQDVTLLKDKDYIAKLARSRYLLSKDGETIYNFPK